MQSDNKPYSSRRMRSSNSRTNSSFNDSAALYDTRRSYSDSLSNQDKLRNLSNRALAEFAYGEEEESMDKASLDRLSRLVQAQAPSSDVGVKIYEDGSENVNLSALRTALQGYHDAEPEKKSFGSSQSQLDSSSYSSSSASQSYTPSASKFHQSAPSNSSPSSYSGHTSSNGHNGYNPSSQSGYSSSSSQSYNPSGSQSNYYTGSRQSVYNSGSNSNSYSPRSSQTSYSSSANISGDWHTNSPKKTTTDRVERKVDLSEHTSIISSASSAQRSNNSNSQSSNVPNALRSQQSQLSSSVRASGLNVQAHNIAASTQASNETEALDTHSSQHSVFGGEYSHGKANAKDANGYGGYNQIGRTSKHSLQHMGHAPIGYTAQASATYHAHANADKVKPEHSNSALQSYGYGSTGFTSSNISSVGNTSGERSHLRSEQGHNEHSSFASAAEASKARKQYEAQQVHNGRDSELNSFTAITSATTGQSAYAAQRAAHMQGPSSRKAAQAILDQDGRMAANAAEDQAAHGSSPVSGQTDAASDYAHSFTNRMSRSNARSAGAPQIGRQAPRANTTLNAVSFGPAAAVPQRQHQAGEYVSAVNPYEMTQINAAKQVNESYSLNSNTGFGALTHEFDAHRNAGSVVTKHTVRKSKIADIAGYAAQNDYGFSSPASRSNGAFKTSDTNVLRNASAKTGESVIQRTVSNYVRVPVQSSSTCIVRSTPTYVSEKATVFVTASGNKTIVGVESAKPVEPLKTVDASKPVAIEAQAKDEAATESTVANVADVMEAAKAVESDAAKASEQLAAEEAAKVIDKATEQADAAASDTASDSSAASTESLVATPDRRATAIVKDGTETSNMISSIEGTAQQPSPETSTVVTGVRSAVAQEEQTEDRVRIVRASASPFVPSPEGKLAAALGTVFSEQEFKGSVIGNTPAEFLKAKPSAAQMEEAPAISAPKSNADFIGQEVLVGNSSTRIVTSSQRLKQSFARSAQISEEIKAEEIKKQEEAAEQADSPATVISVHDIMHKVELTATQAKAAAQASANAHAMIEADLEVTDSKAGKNYGFAEISLILPKSDQNDASDSEEHTPIYAQVPIQIHAEPKARKQPAVQQPAQPVAEPAAPAAASQPAATEDAKPAAKPAVDTAAKASTPAKADKAEANVENRVAQEQSKANAQKSKSESFKDNKKQNKNNKQDKAAKNNAAKQNSSEEVTATAHTVVTAKESSAHSVDHLKEEIAKTEDKKDASAKIEAKADEAYKAADNALKASSEEDKVLEAAQAVATKVEDKETKTKEAKTDAPKANETNTAKDESQKTDEQVSTLVYKQDEAVPYTASYNAGAEAFADPVKAASAAVREALHAEAEAHSHGNSVAEQTAETLSGSAVDNTTAVPMHNLLEGVSADTDLISGDDDLGKVADLGRVSDAPIDSKDVVLSALAEGATKDDSIVDKHIVNRNRRNKNRSRNKRR